MPKMNTHQFLLAVILLFLGQAHPASAQKCGDYEVTAIVTMDECPPFGIPPVVPFGINEQGWMVGNFQACVVGPDTAFLWTPDDGLVVIPMPTGTSRSHALAISGSKVVGDYDNAQLELGTAGFLYDYETDEFTSLHTLPGGNTSIARAINSSGEIVGSWGDVVKGPFPLAFIWQDGEMIDISFDIGTINSYPNDINATGLVTGWMSSLVTKDTRAFIWDDGDIIELPPIPGGITSIGNRINCSNQLAVGGNFDDDHPLGFISGGFLWDAGQWTDLGMLRGYDSMALKGLNDQGIIVGWSRDINNGQHPDTAFVWRDGEMTELDDLLPPESQLHIKRAEAINESGQIIARAVNEDNDTVAVLLTPIKGTLGDLDGDCQVSTVDILLMFSNWGTCESCTTCPADLDKNCTVGVSDLLILFSNWG